jgi:hypothetical protein
MIFTLGGNASRREQHVTLRESICNLVGYPLDV